MIVGYDVDYDAWRDFYKVIGLASQPLLPFYFDRCPYCNEGPVRCTEDKTYNDGWCGCESCYTGKPIIQFLSDSLHIPPQEILTHYSKERYKDNMPRKLDVWQRYEENWNEYNTVPPNVTEALDIPQAYKLPRITNQNWQQRAAGYVYFLDRMLGPAIKIFSLDPRSTRALWHHPKPMIAIKCYDAIGRASGFIVCSEDHNHKPFVMLPPVDRRGVPRAELGFGFGQALWTKSVFDTKLGDTYFVIPAEIAAAWQLDYLRDHTQLLPVLSYVFGTQRLLRDRHKTRRLGTWHHWTDKQFVIWVRELTENIKNVVTTFNCMLYVGDLPEKVHAYDTHLAKLKYLLKHARKHRRRYDKDFN